MTKINLKKVDISKNLEKKTGFPQNLCRKIVDDLINVLIETIEQDKLIIKNIGSFKIINKKERFGRNPKTGETYVINARKSISFVTSKKLLNYLNG